MKHAATRQFDEYFCALCGARWAIDEPPPKAGCGPNRTAKAKPMFRPPVTSKKPQYYCR